MLKCGCVLTIFCCNVYVYVSVLSLFNDDMDDKFMKHLESDGNLMAPLHCFYLLLFSFFVVHHCCFDSQPFRSLANSLLGANLI